MPRLLISGAVYELVGDLITIGRGPDNMIVVGDPSVSNHHAQLQRVGENYRLKDLGSINGTRVNGVPVTETMLQLDDRIWFGATEVCYEADVAASQPLPQIQEVEARPAELSAVPADFANASPFLRRKDQRDTLGTAIFVGSAIILLIFLGSIIAVLFMHAPRL